MKLVLGCAVLVVVIAAPAEAQLCAGAPSFGVHPFHVGVDGAFSSNAQGVGATIAVGRALFGAVTVNTQTFDDLESSFRSVGATAGLEVTLGSDRRAFACPTGHMGFGFGPNVGPLNVSSVRASGGGRLGVVIAETDPLIVVPTVGLLSVYQRDTAEFRGLKQEDSDVYGLATIGIGLIVSRRIGITPGIVIPFSATDPDVAFSLSVAFGF